MDTATFLLLARSSVILALIVLPMLESWVPGHLSRVAPTYKHTHKKRGKKNLVHVVVSKKPIKEGRIITYSYLSSK